MQPALSGTRKAAIVALLMGEDAAAQVLKHLNEDEIELLAREVAALGPVSVQMGEAVLEEFHHNFETADYGSCGDLSYVRRLLKRCLGDDAQRVMERVERTFRSTVGLSTLTRTDPDQLSKFLLGEHPQTIALILAQLNPRSAAHVITLLPDQLRIDVLMRMANLDEISPDVVTRISAVIEQRLGTLGGTSRAQHGGVRAVAELLNHLERGISAPVLEGIEANRPELAVSIRNLMFVFDDLVHIDDSGMREIVQRADKKVLTLALKGASEDIRQKFFSNMSKRAGEMLREEMEVLGAVRLREVEKAQQEIVQIARKLEEEGVIVTGAAAGEAYVV